MIHFDAIDLGSKGRADTQGRRAHRVATFGVARRPHTGLVVISTLCDRWELVGQPDIYLAGCAPAPMCWDCMGRLALADVEDLRQHLYRLTHAMRGGS